MFLQKDRKSKEKEDDFALIKRYIAGDQEAQNTLYILVERLLEKAMKTLELKGSFFRDREDTKQESMVTILAENQYCPVKDLTQSLTVLKSDSYIR